MDTVNLEELEAFRESITNYHCAAMEVETKFQVLDKRFSLIRDHNPIEYIEMRIKSPESITRKLLRRRLPVSVESMEANLTDVAGVRVVCSFPRDIEELARLFLEQDDVELIQKKDYISHPKENGYRSLHLIVRVPVFTETGRREIAVEVQLRTLAMDFWASLEHKVRYKKDLDPEIMKAIGYDLKECAEQSALLDKKMEGIRNLIQGS